MEEKLLLSMQGISKRFGGARALSGVNFSLRKGEVHALMGENGAGKSTLMKILGGVHQLDEGQILVDEKPVRIDNPIQAQSLGIAVIYQEQALVNCLTVADNIFLGRIPQNWGWIKRKELVDESIEVIKQVGAQLNPYQKVSELSVAQRQFVEIAKALSMDARIIVMDEPSSVLTIHEMKILFNLIHILKQQGRSIIYISHRMEEIFEITDRCTVLKDGKYVGTVNTAETDEDHLIRMMTGRKLLDIYPHKCTQLGNEILRVSNLRRNGAFQDVSLKVHAKEIVGIAGLVGSGRTEVARAIFGLDKLDQGEVYISGQKVSFQQPHQAIQAGVVYIPEDRKGNGLVLDYSIGNNMTLSWIDRLAKFGIIRRKDEKKVIESLMNKFHVKAIHPEQWVGELSGGNQQKVMLARGVLVEANIIIVDEPTRGVDVGTKVEIYRILRELANEGKAIIMISSELPEILGMSDRILVMSQGRISGNLRSDEADEEKILMYATGGKTGAA